MWRKELLIVVCCVMWGQSSGAESKCEEKEKFSTSLEFVENLIMKTKEIIPDYPETVTNKSECGAKAKMSAYLDMAKHIISEARMKYPSCIDDENKDCNITEPVTVTTEPNEIISEEPTEYPKDCSEVLRKSLNDTGVYTIWLNSSSPKNRSLEVFCDMTTDLGGWTIIQRRGNFTPQEDFYRGWNDYREGFGDITRDFWLGNENIFILSNQGPYEVRFDMESADGEKRYAAYETFRIENEAAQYQLRIGKYTGGNAGDSMRQVSGEAFYTEDRDNAHSCARISKGGWWYGYCGYSNLNGLYNPGANAAPYDFIYWKLWMNQHVGLAASEIKIRPAL